MQFFSKLHLLPYKLNICIVEHYELWTLKYNIFILVSSLNPLFMTLKAKGRIGLSESVSRQER